LTVQPDFEGQVKKTGTEDRGNQYHPQRPRLHHPKKEKEEKNRADGKSQGREKDGVNEKDGYGDKELSPVDIGPDLDVFRVFLPTVDEADHQVSQSQQAQDQAGEKRHEPRVRLVERAEPQPEPTVTDGGSETDPDQIVDEKGLFQNQPQGN
jgi:hypothetical protein